MVAIDAAAGVDGAGALAGGLTAGGEGARGGASAHAASNPRIAAGQARRARQRMFDMWVILLEAFGALALLVLIVWWTMFAGRHKGERTPRDE